MGVPLKLVTKTVTKPKYPEAPEKVKLYDNVMTQLQSYYDDADAKIKSANKSGFVSSVENSAQDGPYYTKEYITHKDNWFNNSDKMINSFNGYLSHIKGQKAVAAAKKAEWESKALETVEEEVECYVPVDEG